MNRINYLLYSLESMKVIISLNMNVCISFFIYWSFLFGFKTYVYFVNGGNLKENYLEEGGCVIYIHFLIEKLTILIRS